jgi:hypothetical protein
VTSDEDNDDSDQDSSRFVSSALKVLLVSLIVSHAAHAVSRTDACSKKKKIISISFSV